MSLHKQLQLLLGIAGCFVAGSAFAQYGGGSTGGCVISTTGDMTGGVMCQFKAAATQINQKLINPAIATACAAIMLQWILSYWKDLFKPDLTDMLLKGAGLITWFGATVLLIMNMDRMSSMFTSYLALAGSLSSLSAAQFSPGGVIDKALDAISATNTAFQGAAPGSMLDVAANMFAALMLMFANIFTFGAGLVVALSLFVAILEFWIMFSVAPLAFGLIPLSAFRDQGFAPIKGLISLGLRVLILGVVVAVFGSLTDVVIQAMNSKKGVGDASALMGAVWYYLAGLAGCAMMALSAGKIASAIASGSASFSGSDAIRGGMQLTTTAAAGAGAVVAGKALLGAAGGSVANTLGGAPRAGSAYDAGKAMGNMLSSGPGLGVSPSGGSGFGQPLQSRPGAAPSGGGSPSTAGTSPSASPSASSGSAPTGGAEPAGDASSAGIGGPVGDKPSSSGGRERSFGEKMQDAAQQNAQDSHAVSVQMHVAKD